MAVRTGERLGPYEILSAIDADGMGEVYRAHDGSLNRDVALKIIPEIANADRMARFEREARVRRVFNHPNIASIHGLEEIGSQRVLVMEWVEGSTLADRIAVGPIPFQEALPIAKQLAEVLEYAHDRGVIHQDLKPENIRLTPDGRLKVVDFGLAEALMEKPDADPRKSPILSKTPTKADAILGAAAYISPNQRLAADEFPVQRRAGRRIRGVLWSAAVLLIFGAAAGLIVRRLRAKPEMHYDTANVDRGTIAAKVTATGNLSPLLTVQVGSQVSGRVQQLFVDYNSTVKKGQLVAKLDPLLFDAAVEQARANYLSIQGSLNKDQAQENNAKLVYDRTKALVEAQVLAQSELDTASTNYDAAKAQVEADKSNLESARANLNQAEVNRGYTSIVSPIDGIVISRNVDVGQTVAASFQAPTLFVIAQDLRHMQVDTNVGEADVSRLIVGMPATFTVDAYPARPFTGRLRQIRNAAQTIQNVVTYDAVIDVDNVNLLLKPGMTANVVFVAAQKDNVLRLRNAALRFQPDPQLLARAGVNDPAPEATGPTPSRKTVWVLRSGQPIAVAVTLGISDGTWTELVSGDIHAGDALVTDMTPGAPRGFFR